ncbi:TIP41-like family-domain-containing protein [Gongronella butleri]|nr:TIP41-like family-domain-containing protein [Gongronella butleri]
MAYESIQQGDRRTGLVQGIAINGWSITSKKAPICNSTQLESFQKQYGIPPPEMIFGSNYVRLERAPLEYTLNAYDALARVDTSEESSARIKVAYANEWNKKSYHQNVKDVVKPYDWTYSTDYQGTSSDDAWEKVDDAVIDVDHLKQKEPILFYDENILYEDELADNGTAVLSIRLRVMPSCFLILQRFFLRVDDVLFRINDTRLYHAFGSPYLVREYTSRQQSYQAIRSKLEHGGDLSLMNDTHWVASVLPEQNQVLERHRLRIE